MDENVINNQINSALIELNTLNNGPASPIQPRFISKIYGPLQISPEPPSMTNPRYISKIYSSPRRMPNIIPPIRMRPYFIPERSRTKSENAESTSSSLCQETSTVIESINSSNMMDICDTAVAGYDSITDTNSGNHKITNKKIKDLKKSKSLEDIRPEKLEASQQSHEMEFVSNRIQKLRVHE